MPFKLTFTLKGRQKRTSRLDILQQGEVSVDCVWNVTAHAQKPDFVFRRNGRVHFNRQGLGVGQFNRLPAAEVCVSAVVVLDAPCSEVVWRVLATHSIRQFPLHFLCPASPCAITFQLDSMRIRLLVNYTQYFPNAELHFNAYSHYSLQEGTQTRSRVAGIPDLYSGGPGFKLWPWRQTVLTGESLRPGKHANSCHRCFPQNPCRSTAHHNPVIRRRIPWATDSADKQNVTNKLIRN
jgi:hypothetical protein